MIEITEEERAFGFELRELEGGAYEIVRVLGHDLWAVKRRTAEGRIEYAICDGALRALYQSARSVAELKERFRAKR